MSSPASMLNVVVIFAVVLLSSLVGYICYLSRSKHNVMLTTDGELVAVGADAADKNASLDGKGDEFGFDYSSAVAAYEKAKKDFQALPDDQRSVEAGHLNNTTLSVLTFGVLLYSFAAVSFAFLCLI